MSTITSSTSQVYSPTRLRAHSGVVRAELISRPVPYRIACCSTDGFRPQDSHAIALQACRVACMSVDFIRGRRVTAGLEKTVTALCMRRLETMSHLIDTHLRGHDEFQGQPHYLPVTPQWVDGLVVGANTFETVVHLTVGQLRYWAALVFKHQGSRWVCTMADLG